MRITWKELKEMVEEEGAVDDTQIILRVRGNSTEDYPENGVVATLNDYGVLIIKDKLSY